MQKIIAACDSKVNLVSALCGFSNKKNEATLLHLAIFSGDVVILEMLLDYGVEINGYVTLYNAKGYTALTLAVERAVNSSKKESLECIKQLLRNGASCNPVYQASGATHLDTPLCILNRHAKQFSEYEVFLVQLLIVSGEKTAIMYNEGIMNHQRMIENTTEPFIISIIEATKEHRLKTSFKYNFFDTSPGITLEQAEHLENKRLRDWYLLGSPKEDVSKEQEQLIVLKEQIFYDNNNFVSRFPEEIKLHIMSYLLWGVLSTHKFPTIQKLIPRPSNELPVKKSPISFL